MKIKKNKKEVKMLQSRLKKISILFSLCFVSFSLLSQTKGDILFMKDYKNDLLMKGATGKTYLLMQEGNNVLVYIKWSKDYYTVGTLVNNKENGHWYVFGKNEVIRKDVFYSNGEANQVTEFDDKGKEIRKTKFSTNF